MTEDLKPCPFCGGHAEADILRPYRNSSTGEREYGLAVYCTGCGVEMMTCPRDVPEAVIEDVIEAWNRRAPSSEAPRQVIGSPTKVGSGMPSNHAA